MNRVVANGQDPFAMFDISEEEYRMITDPERFSDPAYTESVFGLWWLKIPEEARKDPDAKTALASFMKPNAKIEQAALDLMWEYGVITQLAQIQNPDLITTDINGLALEGIAKQFEASFGPPQPKPYQG